MIFVIFFCCLEYILSPDRFVSLHARTDDLVFLISHTVDGFFSLNGQVKSGFVGRASKDPECIGVILEVFLGAVSVKYDSLVGNVSRDGVLRSCNDGHSGVLVVFAYSLKLFHVDSKQCLAAGASAFASYVVFRPSLAHVADVRDPHGLEAFFDGVADYFDLVHVVGTKSCFFSNGEVAYAGSIDTGYFAGNSVDSYRVLGTKDHVGFDRNWHMRAVSGCCSECIHDVQVSSAYGPNVHHGHGQVLLMHLHMNFVLYNALDVLKCAGEYHRSVSLKDRQVDQMISFHKSSGKFDMVEVGSVVTYCNVYQVLISLDIVAFNAFFISHFLDAAYFEALYGIASDSCCFCDYDLLRLSLLNFSDDRTDNFRVGAN